MKKSIFSSTDSNLDLDIKNYNLEDITNLFNIPIVFDEAELRKAKLTVLQTHPDKSKLPKEYFLFFSSAYKMLYQIYTFRNGKNRNKKENYKEIIDEETVDPSEDSMKLCVEKVKRLNAVEFNKLFNEHYEKCKIQMDEDAGYEEWFRSQQTDDDDDSSLIQTWDQRISEIDRKKHADIEEVEKVGVGKDQGDTNTGEALGNIKGVPCQH